MLLLMFSNRFNMGGLEERANQLERTTESDTVTAERLLSTEEKLTKPVLGLLDNPPLSYASETDVLVFLFSVSTKCEYKNRTYKPRSTDGAVYLVTPEYLKLIIPIESASESEPETITKTVDYSNVDEASYSMGVLKHRIDFTENGIGSTLWVNGDCDESDLKKTVELLNSDPDQEDRLVSASVDTEVADGGSVHTSSDDEGRSLQTDNSVEESSISDPPQVKMALQLLDGSQFEQVVAEIWEANGWETEVIGGAGDRGIDVVATRSTSLYEEKQVIQAKRYAPGNKVGSSEIQKYAGLRIRESDADAVVVVTTSDFTPEAKSVGNQSNLKLINGNDLVEHICKNDLQIIVEEHR